MIDNVKKEGPYINIGSEIALAHARPNNHVKKIGLSFLKTGNEINLIDKNIRLNYGLYLLRQTILVIQMLLKN